MTNQTQLEEEAANGAGESHNKTDSGDASSDDSGWYDEIELVVQGKEIIVSERLLVQNSRYFAFVFGDIDPDADTVVLK